jgi:ADP-glucose pyrophosphorylase
LISNSLVEEELEIRDRVNVSVLFVAERVVNHAVVDQSTIEVLVVEVSVGVESSD